MVPRVTAMTARSTLMTIRPTLMAIVMSGLSASAVRAQHPQMPPGTTHEEHLKQMQRETELKARGTQAMGFDQEKTTHHFRLTQSGGVIEVEVNDPLDSASRGRIRSHLKEIAGEFSRGQFEKPFATHAEQPAGVAVMKRLKAAITYTFEETPSGAVVRIQTTSADARRAVHDFLRYQIREHRTGDPLVVSS
jgi:hypothetical protein